MESFIGGKLSGLAEGLDIEDAVEGRDRDDHDVSGMSCWVREAHRRSNIEKKDKSVAWDR